MDAIVAPEIGVPPRRLPPRLAAWPGRWYWVGPGAGAPRAGAPLGPTAGSAGGCTRSCFAITVVCALGAGLALVGGPLPTAGPLGGRGCDSRTALRYGGWRILLGRLVLRGAAPGHPAGPRARALFRRPPIRDRHLAALLPSGSADPLADRQPGRVYPAALPGARPPAVARRRRSRVRSPASSSRCSCSPGGTPSPSRWCPGPSRCAPS